MAWYPQRDICYARMALEVATRMHQKAHEQTPYHDGSFTIWAKDYSPATPFKFTDGVEVWVSRQNLTPDDDFLTPPGLLAAQESPSEPDEADREPNQDE